MATNKITNKLPGKMGMPSQKGIFGPNDYGMVTGPKGTWRANKNYDGTYGAFYALDDTNRRTSQLYTGSTPWGDVYEGVLGGKAPSATPSWVDGSATPAAPINENRRAPIAPISPAPSSGALLLTPPEDEASADTRRGDFVDTSRTVVNRTTGRTREDEEDELLRNGALLLR